MSLLNKTIPEKLNIKTTILLSFGFFGSMLVWSMYNAYVPLLLEALGLSGFMIGIVMSIDNFFGVVFQPLFGKLSDRTRTRFGRRLPFLFICMPICAALFVFIPHMKSLWSLMAVVILFTFVMSIWRTPAVSLMPDLTPQKFQTQGNGIVNLMGGVGAVIAFAGGGLLYGIGGYPLPFLVGGLLLVGCTVILALFVREPKLPEVLTKEETAALPKLEKKEKKSLILLLFAIFFWFAGYNAVETFFSLYATNILGVTAGQASIMLSIFALSLVIFAIPAGIIGAKIGRRRTIAIGLVGVTLMFIPFIFITDANIARALLVVGGMCWACVNINSLPMVVRISGPLKVGAFIGYYYLFSFSSQIITTPIYGFIYDIVGNYQSLFIYAAVTFALAFICLFFVRHGEADEKADGEVNEVENAEVEKISN